MLEQGLRECFELVAISADQLSDLLVGSFDQVAHLVVDEALPGMTGERCRMRLIAATVPSGSQSRFATITTLAAASSRSARLERKPPSQELASARPGRTAPRPGAAGTLTRALPRFRSPARPDPLPGRDGPPPPLVGCPAPRGTRARRGPGASQEIADAAGRRVALSAPSGPSEVADELPVRQRRQVCVGRRETAVVWLLHA